MVKYYNQIQDDYGVVSCDKIRISFQISTTERNSFENYINKNHRIDIKSYPPKTSEFKYKYFYEFSYQNNIGDDIETMALGYIFNGTNMSEDIKTGYLDFNPNKIGANAQFWQDYHFIKGCSENWQIKRMDIALDIPTSRENVILRKDNRKYGLEAYSLSNRTEYLGKRSNIGFVKVYNKSEESKLPYPLTRIEVTCECSEKSFFDNFPEIYDIGKSAQLTSELLELNDTDLAIVRLYYEAFAHGLDNGLMLFNSMCPKKKQKLRDFIIPESCLVYCSYFVISKLFSLIRELYL